MVGKNILEKQICYNLAWLETMKQPSGYAGPVVHYWQDCLNFIGPGFDWRYEGLICAFLILYKKTSNMQFLNKAIECGNFLLKAQCKNGCFRNSAFESNPNFCSGSTPHDSAASFALLELAKIIKENNGNWQIYFNAALKNFNLYHLKKLFYKSEGIFAQYPKPDAIKVQNPFVPNKIATIIDLLIDLYEMTSQKKYLEIAISCANYIASLQDKDEFFGGIYQANNKERIITFYTARCVPPLLRAFEKTGKDFLLDVCINAIEYIKRMENPQGGFYFGHMKAKEEWKLYKYPVFVAGSADILRAIFELDKVTHKKTNLKKNLEFIKERTNKNGGVQTAEGMLSKNKPYVNSYVNSWKDILPVVGWNDKTLRLWSLLLEEKTDINIRAEVDFPEIVISGHDWNYFEDKKKIEITGTNHFLFNKSSTFSGNNQKLRGIFMRIGFIAERLNLKNSITSKAIRALKLK